MPNMKLQDFFLQILCDTAWSHSRSAGLLLPDVPAVAVNRASRMLCKLYRVISAGYGAPTAILLEPRSCTCMLFPDTAHPVVLILIYMLRFITVSLSAHANLASTTFCRTIRRILVCLQDFEHGSICTWRGVRRSVARYAVRSAWFLYSQNSMVATALMYMLLLNCCYRSVKVTKQQHCSQLLLLVISLLPPLMFVCRMSVHADEARAKVIHCETLDDKQKAKMLLLINTEPDTTLPVFTGVPDFLLGHTLSMHLEGLKAGTTHIAHAIASYPDTLSAIRCYMSLSTLICKHQGLSSDN